MHRLTFQLRFLYYKFDLKCFKKLNAEKISMFVKKFISEVLFNGLMLSDLHHIRELRIITYLQLEKF